MSALMILVNLETKVGGVKLEHPIFNASGPKDVTREELIEIAKSDSSAVMAKSCTIEPRMGNAEPRHYDFKGGAIGSYGLPNLGYKEYKKIFPALVEFGKPIFASISGLCVEDNKKMAAEFSEMNSVAAIELNISCPNIIGKPQVGYDFEQSEERIQEVSAICAAGKKPLGLKLPPYFDFAHYKTIAEIINKNKVSFVTCINSVGNGIVVDLEKESVVIKPNKGFGGVGGIIKPFGLANVRKFRELLRREISIVGVGGVFSGKDAFEYILCGADAVQVGTAFMQSDTKVFGKILGELKEIMQRKGYDKLDDFKGKLKEI